MIKKYKKKPIVINAILLTEDNYKDVVRWIQNNSKQSPKITSGGILIETLEGVMFAEFNKAYIVRGVDGEFYPVRKDIFEKTYEEV